MNLIINLGAKNGPVSRNGLSEKNLASYCALKTCAFYDFKLAENKFSHWWQPPELGTFLPLLLLRRVGNLPNHLLENCLWLVPLQDSCLPQAGHYHIPLGVHRGAHLYGNLNRTARKEKIWQKLKQKGEKNLWRFLKQVAIAQYFINFKQISLSLSFNFSTLLLIWSSYNWQLDWLLISPISPKSAH